MVIPRFYFDVSKKHILSNLLAGDDKDFKPNVNIY